MPDAAVTSQLDRSLLWEHMCAGDMQHDGAEQRAEARGCKWETTPKQSPFSSWVQCCHSLHADLSISSFPSFHCLCICTHTFVAESQQETSS